MAIKEKKKNFFESELWEDHENLCEENQLVTYLNSL